MASRQVALIRGINVGKAKRVAMADLRAWMERLGFSDCRTLLDSGNIIFTAGNESPAGNASRIEQSMEAELGVAIRAGDRGHHIRASRTDRHQVQRHWT